MAQKGFVPPLLSREEYCIMDFVVVLFGAIFGIMVIPEFLFVLGIFCSSQCSLRYLFLFGSYPV